MKLFTIPNIITLMNLLCGCLAIVFAFNGDLVWSAYLVGIAAVLDFLDGFVARALKQYSAIGKDLDSLADMVTFGVVPGIVMFQMMRNAFEMHDVKLNDTFGYWGADRMAHHLDLMNYPAAFVAFLIPLFSALRLAKFNNDTRQSDSFIGVPTPANSILICSFPLIIIQTRGADFMDRLLQPGLAPKNWSAFDQFWFLFIQNPWFLIGVTVLMSILLISEIPLFALKVKGFGWTENKLRYIFLAIALVLLVLLKFIALPLVIVLYVVMSVGNNVMKK